MNLLRAIPHLTAVLVAAALAVPAAPAGAQSCEPGTTCSMPYVASSQGQVYYWTGCTAWANLSKRNLRFFASRAEAEAAGYRVSRSQGCDGPSADSPSAPAQPTRSVQPDQPGPRGTDCTVERVVDGDTLVCTDERRIRLLMIDAPESGQGEAGAVAKAALSRFAPRGARLGVELDIQTTDRYGRTLAHLLLADGRRINELLLEAGVVMVAVYPPNVNHVDAYRAAQARAQAARRGLWATDAFTACPPAEFRAGRCGA